MKVKEYKNGIYRGDYGITYFVLNEVPDTRTIISLILASIIILIQLSHIIS